MQRETPAVTRRLLTIRDAQMALSLSRATIYRLIGRAELEAIHVGGARRVLAASVDTFIQRQRTQAAGTDHE